MKTIEFAKAAIKNGYTGNLCEGWDWIRENLHQLDNIFQSENYLSQKRYKHSCLPFLVTNDMTELEKNALSAAWYLNNDREHKRKEKEYKEKMINNGFVKLTKEIVEKAYNEKKKILLNATSTNDWMTIKVDNIYKPYLFNGDTWGLMKPKARSRGYSLHQFDKAYCKLI